MTRILTREALGQLQIATDDGWLDEAAGMGAGIVQASGFRFPGTLVTVTVNRDHVASYEEMRRKALVEIGMDRVDGDAMFIEST